MEQWENLVKEMLSEADPKRLLASLRLFYDCYIEVNDGGVDKKPHRHYRTLERFLEQIEDKKPVTDSSG